MQRWRLDAPNKRGGARVCTSSPRETRLQSTSCRSCRDHRKRRQCPQREPTACRRSCAPQRVQLAAHLGTKVSKRAILSRPAVDESGCASACPRRIEEGGAQHEELKGGSRIDANKPMACSWLSLHYGAVFAIFLAVPCAPIYPFPSRCAALPKKMYVARQPKPTTTSPPSARSARALGT